MNLVCVDQVKNINDVVEPYKNIAITISKRNKTIPEKTTVFFDFKI